MGSGLRAIFISAAEDELARAVVRCCTQCTLQVAYRHQPSNAGVRRRLMNEQCMNEQVYGSTGASWLPKLIGWLEPAFRVYAGCQAPHGCSYAKRNDAIIRRQQPGGLKYLVRSLACSPCCKETGYSQHVSLASPARSFTACKHVNHSDACAAHVQSKSTSLPTELTAASTADEPPLPSMRLAPLFQQATDQATPPSPLHLHETQAEPAAARRTGAWLAGRPLPRLTAHGTAGTAADPALHELRVASLDRGLLWNEATARAASAAAHSAPGTLMQWTAAAFAVALHTSSQSAADTGERIMQGLRVKAEMQRQQMGPASAAVQVAGKLAAAAASATASQLSGSDHVKTATMVAAAAAAFAASATVAAAFCLPPGCSLDTSAGTRIGGVSMNSNDTDTALTFGALGGVIEQPPARCPEYMSQAGLLFGAVQPGERVPPGAISTPSSSLAPSPSITTPQPGAAISALQLTAQQDQDASPAASIASDKENVGPAKPGYLAAAVSDAPAPLHRGLNEPSVSGATGRAALASRPTLPPRGARRGPQAALPACLVSAPSPYCRRRHRPEV